ncbi:MAG: hypothetical protein OXB84_00415 [Halobacteriovoraceae bacterium]|nr:hypothetical protein [Halobacteriovoraceae bacterium]
MPISVYFFLILQLAIISYMDIKFKKISNFWPLFNGLVFVIFLFLFPHQYDFILGTFIFSFLLIMGGFILFRLKIMGAGDSKYLASLYLLIPLALQKEAFTYCIYSIVIMGCIMLLINTTRSFGKILNLLKNFNIQEIKGFYGSKIPFIPVVFLSWIWFGIDYWEKIT